MIAIPAESCEERSRCERVADEYRRLGLEDVHFDRLGTVLARVGSGPLTVLMDGHIDCVGVGDRDAWPHDPFTPEMVDGHVLGRGAVDELPAIAAMAYGARIARDNGWLDGVTVWLSASVMEEACDGLCMLDLAEHEGLLPDLVVLGEPTDMDVYRGHRGRMSMTITTRGRSAHGAHAERGVNALYLMAPIISEVEALNARLAHDPFLGPGSIIVAHLECSTPSLNAVPDRATIYLDRRLTAGETRESALAEVQALPSLGDAEVRVLDWEGVSWTGEPVRQEQYFPSWVLAEDHPLVSGAASAVEAVEGRAPAVSRWSFSTNGVATMGRLGIPSVGFAPGREELAHTTDERVAVDELIRAAAIYSVMPQRLAAVWPRHGA
jgi:putative selenium metabolism hydrolase